MERQRKTIYDYLHQAPLSDYKNRRVASPVQNSRVPHMLNPVRGVQQFSISKASYGESLSHRYDGGYSASQGPRFANVSAGYPAQRQDQYQWQKQYYPAAAESQKVYTPLRSPGKVSTTNAFQGKRVDPIPPSVKEHFYKDVEMPNLTKDYDAIGFDADHCLALYNIQNICPLLIRADLYHMHDHSGWPKAILDIDLSTNSRALQACQRHSIFDIDKGIILKLG